LVRLVKEWPRATILRRVCYLYSSTSQSTLLSYIAANEASGLRETWSWDVRTKHTTNEMIPTVDGVRGLANWGPQATLFTLGPNHWVQQYDVTRPSIVREAQYHPIHPPSIPIKSQVQHIPGTAPPMPVRAASRTSETERTDRSQSSFSNIQRATNEMAAIEQARIRSEMSSPVSSTSRTDTMSSRSSNRMGYQAYGRHLPSISSRAASGTTFSTISPSMVGRDSLFSAGSMYPSTASLTSSGRRSKGSRLRQEVMRSPESDYVDLFPRTRERLATIGVSQARQLDQENSRPEDLRRQMLEVVFGWPDDIEPLIRDELRFHTTGSTSAVLLSKWLGEVDSDMMAAAISSGNIHSSDWMVLALSQMGGSSSMGKMGQAFVQRLLAQGDFHTSATILLGLGDREDAVEVYVSRNFYMEAILLTCLIFPDDWERQAHLVRRWGEYVVENSQQQLAIRCFSCTGAEPPPAWGSPSPRLEDSMLAQTPSSISSMLSPPLSPPTAPNSAPPTRMTTKNSALKVITSFEAPNSQAQFKFPGLSSTDRTPTNGPGVTPINDSALSPGGTPGGFGRPQRGSNRAMTPGGYRKNRLPSIGETPVDVSLPPFPRPSQLPTPDNSGSDLEKEKEQYSRSQPILDKLQKDDAGPPVLLSSARYEPSSATRTPTTALPQTTPQTTVRTTILPSPAKDAFTALQEKSRIRNTSRDRKPDGLHIRMPSQDQIQSTHYISTDIINSGRGDHRRSTTLNSLHSLPSGGLSTGRSDMTRSDTKSPSISGQSWASAKSPSVSGRSIDQYISSLDEANRNRRKHRSKKRTESREGRDAGEHKPRSKHRTHDRSEDRGRDNRRYIRPAKRSPSSPVPMSPEHFSEAASTPGFDADGSNMRSGTESRDGREESIQQKSFSKHRSGSKASDYSHRTVRHRSPSESLNEHRPGNETSYIRSKVNSRQPSPRAMLDPHGRGRSQSKNRAGSAVRSPSSPLPFSPQAQLYQRSDDDDDPLRLVEANRQRIRSRHRSSSRKPRERGNSSRRNLSPDRRLRADDRSNRASENDEPRSAVDPRRGSSGHLSVNSEQPRIRRQKSERTQKREIAARELEARRESLLRNPEAPPILHPDEVNNTRPSFISRSQTDMNDSPTSWNPTQYLQRLPMMSSGGESGDLINRAASVGPYGLPATPRAMRHPRFDNKSHEAIPSVPEIPDVVQQVPVETYYTGQPMRELPRSMSAPIPEQQQPPMPADLPTHPAFHKALRPTKRQTNFQPLGEIGQHRRKGSGDTQSMMYPTVHAGIDETLHAADSIQVVNVEDPPLLPELQHLNNQAMPPPPPPPPPFPSRNDAESSSLSSNSNVGVINMVLDNEPEDEANVIEVPPPPPMHLGPNARSPVPGTTTSPPPSMSRSGSSHRRGRSDNFKNGIKGITERLRSNSRGRNTKSPEQVSNTPSPYESVPPLYF